MTTLTETRSDLKKTAMKHGADTPIGHACYNLLEMTEILPTAEGDQRRHLVANIARQQAHLASALRRGENR